MASLDEYRSESERLAKVATEKTSSATVLPDKIRNIINTKLEGNKDIIEQQRAAQADYFGAGDVAREKYADTFDPRKKEALVNAYKNQQYGTYAALSDVRANREGTIADIVGEAGRAGTAEAQAAQGAAQVARQVYQDILQEYQWNEQMNLQRAQFARGGVEKQKELTLNDIIALKELGVETPENLTYDEAKNILSSSDIQIPKGEMDETDYVTYAPILQEQLLLSGAGGSLPSLDTVYTELGKMGYNPDSAKGYALQNVLRDYYPEAYTDAKKPTPEKDGFFKNVGATLKGLWESGILGRY